MVKRTGAVVLPDELFNRLKAILQTPLTECDAASTRSVVKEVVKEMIAQRRGELQKIQQFKSTLAKEE